MNTTTANDLLTISQAAELIYGSPGHTARMRIQRAITRGDLPCEDGRALGQLRRQRCVWRADAERYRAEVNAIRIPISAETAILAQRLMLHFPQVKTVEQLFAYALVKLSETTDD